MKSKHYIYHLGDKFLIGSEEYTVKHVNRDMAWVSNDDTPWIVDYQLDKHGFTSTGQKAKPIMNDECRAV